MKKSAPPPLARVTASLSRSPILRVLAAAAVLAVGVGAATAAIGFEPLPSRGEDAAPVEAKPPSSIAPADPGGAVSSLVAALTSDAPDARIVGGDEPRTGLPRPTASLPLYDAALDEGVTLHVYTMEASPEVALRDYAKQLSARGLRPREAERGRGASLSRSFDAPALHVIVTASRGESGTLLTVVTTQGGGAG